MYAYACAGSRSDGSIVYEKRQGKWAGLKHEAQKQLWPGSRQKLKKYPFSSSIWYSLLEHSLHVISQVTIFSQDSPLRAIAISHNTCI